MLEAPTHLIPFGGDLTDLAAYIGVNRVYLQTTTDTCQLWAALRYISWSRLRDLAPSAGLTKESASEPTGINMAYYVYMCVYTYVYIYMHISLSICVCDIFYIGDFSDSMMAGNFKSSQLA